MEISLPAGIDFGGKMSGTSVIAVPGQTTIRLFNCEKNEDADKFLLDMIQQKKISCVFLDAPLNLPCIYKGIQTREDYFFRESDQQLKSVSPMLMGGLTARAMKFSSILKKFGVDCYEVHPPAFISRMKLNEMGYKKETDQIPEISEKISEIIGLPLMHELNTWNEVDALIALAIGILFKQDKAEFCGNPEEGFVYY